MRITKLYIFLLAFTLSGCVAKQSTLEDQAISHTNKAASAISRGNCQIASRHITTALSRPTGEIKVQQLFSANNEAAECYFSYLKQSIDRIASITLAHTVQNKLSQARDSKLFSDSRISRLFDQFHNAISTKNKNHSIPFLIRDDLSPFPSIQTSEHKAIILDRSIKAHQDATYSKRHIAEIMDYAREISINTPQGQRIKQLLPTMNITPEEAPLVANIFPEYAKIRNKAMENIGPFGLSWGMTLEKLQSLSVRCSKITASGRLTFCETVKPPKDLYISKKYTLIFDDINNLQKIVMKSRYFKGDPYGTNGMTKYSDLKKKLMKKYGAPIETKEYSKRMLFKERDEFYQCLAYKDCGERETLYKSIYGEYIRLELQGIGGDMGYIELSYEGPSWSRSLDTYKIEESVSDADAL